MNTMMTVPQRSQRVVEPMNGVDTPRLLATINLVGSQPDLAKFQFRATSRWLSGTHSRSTMHGYFGAGGEHRHVAPYTADGDHPAVLCGADAGPTPVEWVLHGDGWSTPAPAARRGPPAGAAPARGRGRPGPRAGA